MTASQIADCIRNNTNGHWITYKCRRDKHNPDAGREQIDGLLSHVTQSVRGVTIHLDNGKQVLWPMSNALAMETAALVQTGLI